MARRVERRRFWVGHVARFNRSGLTRREYCVRHEHVRERLARKPIEFFVQREVYACQ
ncbi:MAG: hypothetical protein H0T88_02865 [Lysobacter sp.]|nr:hypothetical protein [Lysobacter sp.]